MRIFHLIEGLGAGGVTTVLLDLAERQRSAGHDVRIGALQRAEWDDRARAAGFDVSFGARVLARLRAADVVHCHQRRCGLIAVAAGRRSRTVEHVHNVYSGGRALSFYGKQVVAVSDHVAHHLTREYPRTRGKLRTIRQGVDRGEFRRTADSGRQVRRVVAAGRLEEQKDPLYFLEIVAELRRGSSDVEAFWFGEGELRDAFLARRAELGLDEAVTLSGWLGRDELRKTMSDADLLLLASRWEGLGLVALEALSAGTPVAVTPCGDIADMIQAANAVVVLPFGDAPVAGRRCQELLRGDPSGYRHRAADLFDRDLSLGSAADRWDELYRALVRRTGR